MTRQEIATLIVRTLALLILLGMAIYIVMTLIAIAIMFQAFQRMGRGFEASDLIPFSVNMVGILALVGVGTLVWIFADDIGRRMVGDDPKPVLRGEWTPGDLLAVALAVVGAVKLFDGMRELVIVLMMPLFRRESDVSPWFAADFVLPGLQIAMALAFLLGFNGLRRGIDWLRTAGTPLAEPDPPEPTPPAVEIQDRRG